MKKGQSDQALNFKKRARRRLVGAIALVLLMIIFLPMILEDREAGEQQENIIVTMDNQVPFNELDTSGFDSSIVLENNVVEESVEVVEDSVAIEMPVKIEPKAESKQKEKVAAKPTVEVKSNANPIADAADKHYVQVGVYSDAANVKKLAMRLKDLGYQSKTEKISTAKGEKIRLRTTAFIGRNEAIIALENIKDSGLTGIVLKQK
jgi:DedD protein